MKNILKLLLLLVLFVSCKKEEPIRSNEQTVVQTDEPLTIIGQWVITDGELYIESETGKRTKYSHFSTNRKVSSMRYGGSLFNIETIIKDVTTWEFIEYSQRQMLFILNNDSDNPYNVTSYDNGMFQTFSIIERQNSTNQQMGGSAKPFIIYRIDRVNKVIQIKIHESSYNKDGYNYFYYSILTLKKL